MTGPIARVSQRLRMIALILRLGPKAAVEVVYGQIMSFTQPRTELAECGAGTYFDRSCSIRSPENISIGKKVSVGPDNRLWASPKARLTIEDDVLLGPNVTVVTSNYSTADLESPIHAQKWIEADVVLGRRSWIGANVVVLPGVRIGEGVVIAAGAVVTTSIPAFAIAAGVPAKIIKMRGAEKL